MVTASGFRPIRFGEGTSAEKSRESRPVGKKDAAQAIPVGMSVKEDSPVHLSEPITADTINKSEAAAKTETATPAETTDTKPVDSPGRRNKSGLPRFFAPGGFMYRVLEAVQEFFQRLAHRFEKIANQFAVQKHAHAVVESLNDIARETNAENRLKHLDVAEDETGRLTKSLHKLGHPRADEMSRGFKSIVHEGRGMVYAREFQDIGKAKAHLADAHRIASQEPPVFPPERLKMLEHVQHLLEEGRIPTQEDFEYVVQGKGKPVKPTESRSTDEPALSEAEENTAPVVARDSQKPGLTASDMDSNVDNGDTKPTNSRKARVEEAPGG